MKSGRGDVVVVEFPHAGGQGSSLRPALVIQSDHFNRLLSNTIVAQITSKIRHLQSPARLLIDPATPEGHSSGVHMLSVIACENLVTIRQDAIHQIIGRLSSSLMSKVQLCLKAALELP